MPEPNTKEAKEEHQIQMIKGKIIIIDSISVGVLGAYPGSYNKLRTNKQTHSVGPFGNDL